MAFLDCNIWEVNKFPRYGVNFDRHTISNIFHYCSDTTEFQNNNVSIQIPEFELIGTEEQKQFVNKYMSIIVKNSIPVIYHKINNNGIEEWVLDLTKVRYLLHKTNKET